MPPIPRELAFLEPAVAEMRKLAPDELDEDYELDDLIDAIRTRLEGMEHAEADATLDDIRQTLEKWLEGREDAPDALPWYWIRGALMHLRAKDVWAPPPDFSDMPVVHADVPAGMKVTQRSGCLDIEQGPLLIVIHPAGLIDAWLLRLSHRTVAVVFGAVTGRKALGPDPRDLSTAQYVLRVPGGRVHVSVDAEGDPVDPAMLSALFGSIRLSAPGGA